MTPTSKKRKSIIASVAFPGGDKADRPLPNEILNAVSAISGALLALIDEAFVFLDSGLGAVFSFSLARRAAMQRAERQQQIQQTPSSDSLDRCSPKSGDSFGGFFREAAMGRTRSRRGIMLFKKAVQKIVATRRQHKAQEVTLNFFGQMANRRGERKLTTKALVTEPESMLLEDNDFRHWATETLGVNDFRLKGLENSLAFRHRLQHHMLSWEAFHTHAREGPSFARGEKKENEAYQQECPELVPTPPSPRFVRAAKTSFGLSRHSDAMRIRRVLRVPPRGDAEAEVGPGAALLRTRLPSLGQTRDGAFGVSLRAPPPFEEPHSHFVSQDIGRTPEFAYFKRCQRSCLVPCPAIWQDFDSGTGTVGAQSKTLCDAELVAVVETAMQSVANGSIFASLCLDDNGLTDAGLSRVARLLSNTPDVGSNLVTFSLAGNTNLRFGSELSLVELENAFKALPNLSQVNFSRVPLGGKPVMRLMAALRTNCTKLATLELANCGLGRMDQRECVAVAELLSCKPRADGSAMSVFVVDISGNFFGRAGFQAIGDALRESKIQELSVAHNGGMNMLVGCQSSVKDAPRFNPVQLLIEGLLYNSTIQALDLSHCGIGPDTAFVLEEALTQHLSISRVVLDGNPLGDDGLRSVVRLIVRKECFIQECVVTNNRESDLPLQPTRFRQAQPSGIYTLNLEYPHSRATFRMLLRVQAEKPNSGHRSHLQYFSFEGRQAKPLVEKHDSAWIVPSKGTYTFNFQPPCSMTAYAFLRDREKRKCEDQMERRPSSTIGRGLVNEDRPEQLAIGGTDPVNTSLGNRPSKIAPSWFKQKQEDLTFEVDVKEVVDIVRAARIPVSTLRYLIFREMLMRLGTVEEHTRFIRACSKDLSFNTAQVVQLCAENPTYTTEIFRDLFPSIRDRGSQIMLLTSPNVKLNIRAIAQEVRECLWFVEGNVTGRYRFDLAKSADFVVAENCLIVNAWESEVAKAQGRPDVSQRGNFEMIRNEMYNEQPFVYGRDWTLPTRGIFSFDYSSIRRPSVGSSPMLEAAEVARHLKNSAVASEAKLKALRAISLHSFFSAKQFRTLAMCFKDGLARQDLFCCFHTRVVDPMLLLGPEVLHSKTLFSDRDREALLQRVGHLHLLNPLLVEGVIFKCNFAVYEERRVINFLAQLADAEPGCKAFYYLPTSGWNPVPASWCQTGVPTEDTVVLGRYDNSNPGHASSWREELASVYCGPHFGHFIKEARRPPAKELPVAAGVIESAHEERRGLGDKEQDDRCKRKQDRCMSLEKPMVAAPSDKPDRSRPFVNHRGKHD